MAFTYVEGGTDTRSRVRLEIGDTDISKALFSDAELDDIIVQETDALPSAARACEILARRFARDYDFSADGASFKKSSMSKMYKELALELRDRATGTTTDMPVRKDGYSDDIASDEATGVGSGVADFDTGRWNC